MKHLPSLKNLFYLVNLHQEQNFNRAAKVCHVSQSTLSSGIQNLEEQLGHQLIERDHKSFIFTAIGEEVVQRSRKLLTDVDDLVELVKHQGEPMTGDIRLGCIPTIAPFLLSKVVKHCQSTYADLTLFLKEDTTERLLDALGKGELDLLLLALPVDTSGFHSMKVGIDPFKLVVHEELTDVIHEPLDYESLPDQSIFLLQAEHCITGHAVSACELANSAKVNPFAATSLHTLVQMVNSKLGTTFLPQMAIDAGILNDTELRVMQPPGEAPYREIGLVWRQTSSRILTFRTLGLAIQNILEQKDN
ncbi:hydrogen peroxide-inducible genes activator [Shewanella psychropiezotolerans]|uniref:Hydrogen peroxide-inducible genes activator n=1 Tax=Shewanella psychropiezotolerans TaxID=2593655 RepID=A0ABX5X226_9GAMM|nr:MULTISPECIES: hydrogen peroxide-inducible genes transcriptional activator OxyR [Shewanella]MBE7215351.1 hydrogen peroxide-inducible genes activator [Shewanella benthica]MCL1064364.1 hydrogen peroxide-inducible genes transcriptional activator OxyR [Shewanella benthica]MPY23302.1 hydrogen peroxide-inducible genes activator [Shewanella sp. YLB-07]QDO85395.1 hydrogen peroxide-inducible genes activator [Shewanella psychropiezotolerans]